MYSVSLSDQAKAFFEEATASLQKRLDRCFDQLKLMPYRHSHIRPLRPFGVWNCCHSWKRNEFRTPKSRNVSMYRTSMDLTAPLEI